MRAKVNGRKGKEDCSFMMICFRDWYCDYGRKEEERKLFVVVVVIVVGFLSWVELGLFLAMGYKIRYDKIREDIFYWGGGGIIVEIESLISLVWSNSLCNRPVALSPGVIHYTTQGFKFRFPS